MSEDTITEIQIALARLETAVTAGFARMDEKLDGLSGRVDNLESSGKRMSTAVASLEVSRKSIRASIKWIGGILATVVAALVLAKIGLKP
jgi:Haemolysin XhlA